MTTDSLVGVWHVGSMLADVQVADDSNLDKYVVSVDHVQVRAVLGSCVRGNGSLTRYSIGDSVSRSRRDHVARWIGHATSSLFRLTSLQQ